ncbi:MAG: hypothetical protein US20_C0005G0032 [Candidatus Pacebacteria bacterium GW2011_GWF1_36_5]|nr:MAG: hypothetical protein US20_C0005G0032 [Candidatus Pacebacteria bacterium GW2011_GWF1_36_5]
MNARITILELMGAYNIETYKDLADITGFKHGSIKNWASGKIHPSSTAMVKIREAVVLFHKQKVNDFLV